MNHFKDYILMLIIENKVNLNENLFHFHWAISTNFSNRICGVTVFSPNEINKGKHFAIRKSDKILNITKITLFIKKKQTLIIYSKSLHSNGRSNLFGNLFWMSQVYS